MFVTFLFSKYFDTPTVYFIRIRRRILPKKTLQTSTLRELKI